MKSFIHTTSIIFRTSFLLFIAATPCATFAGKLLSPSPDYNDNFGEYVSISQGAVLVAAHGDKEQGFTMRGSAYYFTGARYIEGVHAEGIQLYTDGLGANAYFGERVALSGGNALVSYVKGNSYAGQAMLFRGLDTLNTTSGSITQNVTLAAFDGGYMDEFGICATDGNRAIVGAFSPTYSGADGEVARHGKAYYFKDISTAVEGATYTDSVRLEPFDGEDADSFGWAVAISGDSVLVGAAYAPFTSATNVIYEYAGAAYYFKSLDTRTLLSTTTECVRLMPATVEEWDTFGAYLALDGDNAAVGLPDRDNSRGYVMYFRNLDNAINGATIGNTQTLSASDGAAYARFGSAIAAEGNSVLVGAFGMSGTAGNTCGAVYYFDNLALATTGSTVTETLKITAFDETAEMGFGIGVAMKDGVFAIGAQACNPDVALSGGVYTGAIDTLTTFNTIYETGIISFIRFVTHKDWVIGDTVVDTTVKLCADAGAEVAGSDNAVYIGRGVDAKRNTLDVAGSLKAGTIHVGAAGNSNNMLKIESGASLTVTTIRIEPGNCLMAEGDYRTRIAELLTIAGGKIQAGGTILTADNIGSYASITYDYGYTTLTVTSDVTERLAWAGTVYDSGNDTFCSSWYGWFYNDAAYGDYIMSYNDYSWQYVFPDSTPDNLVLYDFKLQAWLYTDRGYFAKSWVYNYSTKAWQKLVN